MLETNRQSNIHQPTLPKSTPTIHRQSPSEPSACDLILILMKYDMDLAWRTAPQIHS